MTSKVRKSELSFLYATRRLVLFYLSTKYHKNVPKGINYLSHRVDMKSISNKTKGDNSKSKKARVVILVCNTFSRPVLHFYQVLSKYSKDNIQVTEQTRSFT